MPHDLNERFTPDGHHESWFRQQVRDLLGLDFSARDARIFDELRRLKRVEQRVMELEAKVAS